ncbi:hypothetical protein BGZ65_008973 [Modicella reniformis]|uniref:GST N-terminal domain-containing protein n=1 Tax=Modicella reniformis TaxID=1440133 RepID=A0A9P6ITW5_9FUNG|nr:hypothetical protein BGZ65_008973 [Modicella reniformis]
MTSPIIPTITRNISSQELSKVLEAKENKFELFYFNLNTHGATSSALLAYDDAEWKMIHSDDWFGEDKPLTKFGTLPILYENSADDKHVVEIAEALNIELYLAHKFNLLGDNIFEESQILGYYSNSRALMHRQEDAYFTRSQFRKEEYDKFVDEKLKQCIRTHEKALKENGNNGTLCRQQDIKTAVAIDQLLNKLYVFKGYEDVTELINKEVTHNLWKVRETVLEKKSYRKWLDSEEFKATAAETQSYFDIEYNQL